MVSGAAATTPPKRALPHAAFFGILLLLALIYYPGVIARLPVGIHDWAQGDRLALAISFYDNGMAFFLPATLNQMSSGGVVGVELPLQSYLAALLAKVFGRASIPVCFRLLNIAISWAGLYALFRAVFDRYRNFLAAILPPLMMYFAPVFVVYSGNFLPDPAAVSFCFTGFYFFLRYADGGKTGAFLACAALMTLAVLIKASTLGYIATLFCIGFYREAVSRKSAKGTIAVGAAAMLSASLFVGQYFYIGWLNERYHAWLFTAQAHPFRSMDDVEGFIGTSFKETWLGEYFLLAQYPVMAFLIAFGLSCRGSDRKPDLMLLPLIPFLIAALVMFWLFGRQLTEHDYYMLPIFYPLIGYALVVAAIRTGRRYPGRWPKPALIGTVSTLLLLFFFADHQIYMRLQEMGRYKLSYSYTWAQGGAAVLGQIGVPQNAQIVVAGDAPPNLSLVYFDRKGYVIPQEQWNQELANGTRLLREKSLEYLVMKETSLDTLSMRADSLALREQYNILYRGNQKAVLRLKR